jgi:hypothetical protein
MLTIQDNDPLDLSGSNGERITVTVTSSKTVVDLLLNGQVFTGNQFTLDKTRADAFRLSVGGIYTDKTNGGGTFSVSLAGSGPAVATKAVTQFSAAEARRSFAFTIDVV